MSYGRVSDTRAPTPPVRDFAALAVRFRSALAECLLDACQSAWVFGGMGSWNDLAFDGEAQAEYERTSQTLVLTLTDVIQAAANASSSAAAEPI